MNQYWEKSTVQDTEVVFSGKSDFFSPCLEHLCLVDSVITIIAFSKKKKKIMVGTRSPADFFEGRRKTSGEIVGSHVQHPRLNFPLISNSDCECSHYARARGTLKSRL